MGEATARVQFHRVDKYSSRQFREAMRIYLAEFPRDSRLSLARIRELLKAGDYQLLVAADAQRVLGFALIWLCRQPAFVHLDYIAVSQDTKGKGVGTSLYRWLIAHLKDLLPRAQLLTLEVGDDLIPFYRRSRTKVLHNTPYLFPGPLGPVPMHLMVYDALARAQLDRRTVRGVIRGLYCGLHRREARDALLQSCLAQIPTQISLT